MTVQKFITIEKLVEYLDQEVGNLLLSSDVYDIGNYGWQSEDTEDPNYIGHAIWQTNPPVEAEWEYLFGDGPVRHRPTEKEKLLTVAGNDFEGLMRASRLSIGLCLLHETIAARKPLDDNHYFWLHHTDSILLLNMASDRIREYFLVAFFDETSDGYKRKGKNNGRFVTPFIKANDLCRSAALSKNIVDAVAALPDMADRIYSFRESRNGIVHEISTKLGKMQEEFIEDQQQAFDSKRGTKTAKEYSLEEMSEMHVEIEAKHKEELSRSSESIIEWYKILVKFSSHVFETEYWLRKHVANSY